MRTRIASASNMGPRENLEDALTAFCLALPCLSGIEVCALLVFDGVGGKAHGEVASALARDRISSYLAAFFSSLNLDRGDSALAPDAILDVLQRSLALANRAILQEVTRRPALRGMATTAVCALIVNGTLYVAWAGDSRCYLHHDASIRQLTHDHSEAQRLVEAGLLDAEEATSHVLAHTIYRFLGQPDGVAVETGACRLFDGDIVLLCTDGLTDVLSDAQITAIIQTCRKKEFTVEQLPHRLVQEALSAGTTDNVTVLCCEYQSRTVAELHPIDRTRTGAYPVEVTKALESLRKENSHV